MQENRHLFLPISYILFYHLQLDDNTKLKLVNKEETNVTDFIKNPIVIKNKYNYDIENISEKMLQTLILEDIPSFLKELGEGYSFIKNEYKIKIGNTYNYIDLLLFNIKFNCYVVIELKVCELKKEHIGQIEVYMNYIDKHIKNINQDKTIGIIISRRDNHYYIEYCSDSRIYTRDYIISQEAFMNYYNEIKNKLIDNEVYKRVKNYSKNRNDLSTYYEVGKLLFEAGDHYGEGIISDYSKRLTLELGRGYSKRNLWLMLKFYKLNEKVQTLSAELTWSHYIELLSLENTNEINYYISIIEGYNLSVRELRERIKNKEYQRLDDNTKLKLINKEEVNVSDFIKNPIVIKNKYNYDIGNISEKMLQRLILEDIPSFLKELGDGFSFIENEYIII